MVDTNFTGVVLKDDEGLVDTAGEEGLVESEQMDRLEKTLQERSLMVRRMEAPVGKCSGVGGVTREVGRATVPESLAGTSDSLKLFLDAYPY